MIPACRLWEKTSAKGNRYLVGRLGSVRVLVMPNTRPDADGASHMLMFAEAAPYDASRSHAAQAEAAEPSSATPAKGRPHRNEKRPQLDDDVGPLPEDDVPF